MNSHTLNLAAASVVLVLTAAGVAGFTTASVDAVRESAIGSTQPLSPRVRQVPEAAASGTPQALCELLLPGGSDATSTTAGSAGGLPSTAQPCPTPASGEQPSEVAARPESPAITPQENAATALDEGDDDTTANDSED